MASQVNTERRYNYANSHFDLKELTITNADTDNALEIDQNGAVGTDVSTDGALHIENTGNTGIGLGVYSNLGATADAPLVVLKVDNTLFDQNVLSVINDGLTLDAISIDQNGAGRGLFVDHDDLGAGASIEIDRDGNNAARIFGMKIVVDNAGASNLVGGIDFSGMSDTEPLFKLTSTDTDLSSKAPQTDACAGFFPVLAGTTTYAVPIYALS